MTPLAKIVLFQKFDPKLHIFCLFFPKMTSFFQTNRPRILGPPQTDRSIPPTTEARHTHTPQHVDSHPPPITCVCGGSGNPVYPIRSSTHVHLCLPTENVQKHPWHAYQRSRWDTTGIYPIQCSFRTLTAYENFLCLRGGEGGGGVEREKFWCVGKRSSPKPKFQK